MKKKLLTLFLTACMLLVSASAADMMVISPNSFASDPWGLTMTMKDVTSTGGTIVFTQSGGAPTGELETGEPYWLEMQANGQWVPMEAFNNLAWIMPAYPIPTGGSREFSVNWSFICGALPAGTYRIAKNVMDFRIPGDYDEKVYYAEFSIAPEDTAAWSSPFTDVQPGSDWYDAVRYVYENGFMQGKNATTFDPYGVTTRGQIVTILWRLEKQPVVNYSLFPDVDQESYYAEAIRWASSERIVDGYTDGTLRPDTPISLQQLATILWRYAKYKGMDVSVGENTNILSYTDAFDVSEYAIPAMQWACGAGLMGNSADGSLAPTSQAIRAHTAYMLATLLKPA